MSEFPECLLIVIAEVDTAIEGEWNRWYDTVHLPDALRCPGVRRGRRYVSSGEVSETAAGKTERTARRIYTTIYELDSPDAVAPRDKPGRRPRLPPARDGGAGNHGSEVGRPLYPPLLPPLPSQRGPPAARGHRLQPWQPATPAGLARRHPLVPDEPATAALQDRRAPHPPCPVLHAAACGELLDTAPVPPDYRPHRATRVAPDVIQRSASREADRRRWKCSCV